MRTMNIGNLVVVRRNIRLLNGKRLPIGTKGKVVDKHFDPTVVRVLFERTSEPILICSHHLRLESEPATFLDKVFNLLS